MPQTNITFTVRSHLIAIQRLEKLRWRVKVDGRNLSSYCSESRARAAGRLEAQRLDFIARDAMGRR